MHAPSDGDALSEELASILAQLLDQAQTNLEAEREAARLALTRASSLLHIEMERLAAGRGGAADRGVLAGWQVHRVQTYVDSHLDGPIQIRDLAALARRSSGHFCRAFKRTFGETPHAFVIGRRLQRARELMLTTDDSIAQIALVCEFSDQPHLTKLFRSRYDQSPAAWRRGRRDRHDLRLRSRDPEPLERARAA